MDMDDFNKLGDWMVFAIRKQDGAVAYFKFGLLVWVFQTSDFYQLVERPLASQHLFVVAKCLPSDDWDIVEVIADSTIGQHVMDTDKRRLHRLPCTDDAGLVERNTVDAKVDEAIQLFEGHGINLTCCNFAQSLKCDGGGF